MKRQRKAVGLISGWAVWLLIPVAVYCQSNPGPGLDSAWNTISLNDLGAFESPGQNWTVAADAWSDFRQKEGVEKIKDGSGIVINDPSQYHTHLITRQQFGDIELELDFMMSKGSNSGVYLLGRYEVQLFDSWMQRYPSFGDCGGIYQRWDDARPEGEKGYEGIAPLTNACLAPGLWQHLQIRFRAPRFNEKGEKTANARFEKVYLNGVLVQNEVEVTGPTRSSFFADEKSAGPLVLQGDHGPVAFRDIRYRLLSPETLVSISRKGPKPPPGTGPAIITPVNKPYLLRSFMMFGNKKLAYVISMGTPGGLNYAYDLQTGALLQVWRGRFLDVSDMWQSRGIEQLAVPLGNAIALSDAPPLAVLPDDHAPWPDTIAFDGFRGEGYMLDKDRIPVFSYVINRIKVNDKIVPEQDMTAFSRTIDVVNPSPGLYCRIVTASSIETIDRGLYRIDGNYYIRLDSHFKPQIRQTEQGQEMLVSLADAGTPLTYSIIW